MEIHEEAYDHPPVQTDKSSGVLQMQDHSKGMQAPEMQDSSVSADWLVEVLEDCFMKDVQLAFDTALKAKAIEIQANVKVKLLSAKEVEQEQACAPKSVCSAIVLF